MPAAAADIAKVNATIEADPSGAFRRKVRARFEAEVLKVEPAIADEPDVLEITAEGVMAAAGIGVSS